MATDKIELTAKKLANLKPASPGERYEIADTHVSGMRVRVGDEVGDKGKAAQISFVLLARFSSSNPTRRTIGVFPAVGLAEAREQARRWKDLLRQGIDPAAEQQRQREEAERAQMEARRREQSFNAVADAFLERHVERQALRSAGEVRRILAVNVRPKLGLRPITDIRRSDIADLLDDIEDQRGPTMADRTLATLSKLFRWHASRENDFIPPIVPGMNRTKASERARARILNDDEIRLLWRVTGQDTFGRFVRVLLLSAQRRAKITAMRWDDIGEDGIWAIPTERREKGNPGELKMSPLAMEVIREQPRRVDSPFVFAGRLDGPIGGFSKLKAALDAKLAEANDGKPLADWVLHDLRRTARSLLSRAGVQSDVAEHVLGHHVVDVKNTYDRHHYRDEKADALERLARLIGLIIAPPEGNVVTLERGAA